MEVFGQGPRFEILACALAKKVIFLKDNENVWFVHYGKEDEFRIKQEMKALSFKMIKCKCMHNNEKDK